MLDFVVMFETNVCLWSNNLEKLVWYLSKDFWWRNGKYSTFVHYLIRLLAFVHLWLVLVEGECMRLSALLPSVLSLTMAVSVFRCFGRGEQDYRNNVTRNNWHSTMKSKHFLITSTHPIRESGGYFQRNKKKTTKLDARCFSSPLF